MTLGKITKNTSFLLYLIIYIMKENYVVQKYLSNEKICFVNFLSVERQVFS